LKVKTIVPVGQLVIPVEIWICWYNLGLAVWKWLRLTIWMTKLLEKKHNLEIVIFCEDATMNSFGLHYQGKTVLSFVRKSKELRLQRLWQRKWGAYLNKVGTSEKPSGYRTKVIRSMVLENGSSKTCNKSVLVDGEIIA
jgi:valyl-tRNA synthetase